jgi:cobalt-zinc-cadmium efflux system membrane fusion protein
MSFKSWLLAGVSLALAGPALAAELTVSEQQQQALGIETASATRRADAATGSMTFRVAFSADAEWVIKSPLPGVLYRALVHQGDRVRTGEPLAVIHSPEFVTLQRDYLESHAELALAESAWRRDAKLREAGSVAERRWQETEYHYRTAVAELAGLKGRLVLAGLGEQDLERLAGEASLSSELVLRSPADAIVLSRPVPLGSQLDGSEILVRLGDPERLVLNGIVARTVAEGLHEGMRLGLQGSDNRAVIVFVSSVLDTGSQTADVRAVPDSPAGLAPGQLSDWDILAGEPLLVLPSSAVVRLEDRDVVYVAVPGGFEARPVTVRGTASGDWIVLDGLADGERVAVRGTAALKGASLGLGGGEG